MKQIKAAPWHMVGALVIATIFTMSLSVSAQEMKDMKGMSMPMNKGNTAKTTTIQGEVVDLACYMTKGEHGASHADCAQMCINSGLPVGILDKSGHVYLCMMANHKSANSVLVQYAAKQVKITGTFYKKGGMDMLAVDKVEPIDKETSPK
jgi:hypothetical protein